MKRSGLGSWRGRVEVGVAASMFLALLLLGLYVDSQQTTEVPQFEDRATVASPKPVIASSSAAMAALNDLEVADKNQATYNRAAFGDAWEDVNHNGCDTRNDILARDLTDDVMRDACVVAAGRLQDPYTGKVIEFVRGRGTSTKVQIDHVVSLGDAWRSGSWDDNEQARLSLANDPLNLLAVDGPTNASKSDGDAVEWLPPAESARCGYVARQVAVKTKYGLSVTPGEIGKMRSVLSACPAQKLPTE